MRNTLLLKINGLDCASCVINIDGVLEETKGIYESRTNYAKEKTSVTFDPQKISIQKIIGLISKTGYKAAVAN